MGSPVHHPLRGRLLLLSSVRILSGVWKDRDVFSPRREKSAPQNLHFTCIDNGSNNGVLKCKFRLPELSNSGHFQMLQTDSRLDRGNLDPRQETWSTGLSSIWRHVSWSYPLHTC